MRYKTPVIRRLHELGDVFFERASRIGDQTAQEREFREFWLTAQTRARSLAAAIARDNLSHLHATINAYHPPLHAAYVHGWMTYDIEYWDRHSGGTRIIPICPTCGDIQHLLQRQWLQDQVIPETGEHYSHVYMELRCMQCGWEKKFTDLIAILMGVGELAVNVIPRLPGGKT